MSRHDDRTRLLHMLNYGQEAIEMAKDRQRQDLDTDRTFRFALTHLVEIIGEAANHISEPFQQSNSQIQWAGIVGLRNRLIHGYSEVDLDLLWKIIQVNLPPLIVELRTVLKSTEQ